jgi:hypothetical protein
MENRNKVANNTFLVKGHSIWALIASCMFLKYKYYIISYLLFFLFAIMSFAVISIRCYYHSR